MRLWMFPHMGFTMWKHQCVDIWSGYVSGYWRCSSSIGIPMLSNMVSKLVWRPAPVVDRDREAELLHLHFHTFSYIYELRGLFHCIRSTCFIQEYFSFHSKRFMFSQDTTISVKSRGIKPTCAFLKFLQSIILALYYLFPGFYSFISMYALSPMPCVISTNPKQLWKGASSG